MSTCIITVAGTKEIISIDTPARRIYYFKNVLKNKVRGAPCSVNARLEIASWRNAKNVFKKKKKNHLIDLAYCYVMLEQYRKIDKFAF